MILCVGCSAAPHTDLEVLAHNLLIEIMLNQADPFARLLQPGLAALLTQEHVVILGETEVVKNSSA